MWECFKFFTFVYGIFHGDIFCHEILCPQFWGDVFDSTLFIE